MAVSTRVGDVVLFERILQRQGIDDRGDHAHVIGGRSVHAARARRQAAENVAAADHDGSLHAQTLQLRDVFGNPRRDNGIHAICLVAHERFAGKFQENASVGGIGRSRPATWREEL